MQKTSLKQLVSRRNALLKSFSGPAVLAAGAPISRNYPANPYAYRSLSHFLYFVGQSIPNAAVLFAEGAARLFVDPPDDDDALWHGPRPSLGEISSAFGFDEVLARDELREVLASLGNVATIPPQDPDTAEWLTHVLGRPVVRKSGASLMGVDAALADAIIALRSIHDAAALARLSETAEISANAHIAGMMATRPGGTEAAVVAAMLAVLRTHQLEDAYPPIVTVHGEVLHNHAHDHALAPGDMVLADVGGEHPEGWAADITRTWPVTGTYSKSQRAIYDVVLDAQLRAIDKVRPGVRYRDVHETAKRALVEGLHRLGIFRGTVDGLLERGAASLFFPHGVGHLLGLDVHDMEDLGDRPAYPEGRSRSEAFGDAFLRLDRDLISGMVVTVEPGFYQVPAILQNASLRERIGADLVESALEPYRDVRGIRIEDDVHVRAEGPEVLTALVPKAPNEIEKLMAGRG